MTNKKCLQSGFGQIGFSLLELLIALAIVGIISAFAIPNYIDYINKGYRTDMQRFMLEISSKQENFFANAQRYTDSLAADGLNISLENELANRYTVQIEVTDVPPSYEILATAKGAQLNSGNLTLNSSGEKTPLEHW